MRRFRLAFAAVAFVLVVSMALLARRALQSVELERDARHETVAERLFDEMERSLSQFLATEERRAFGEYSHDYTPPGEPSGALVRSPLAGPPAEPFVIGYFQVDPDGGLRFPLDPRGKTDAPRNRALSPQAASSVREIERSVAPYWRSGGKARNVRELEIAQAPGSTLELDDGARRKAAELGKTIRDEKAKSEKPVSAYDALRALNRGVEQRADRQSKVSKEYAKQALEAPAASISRDMASEGRGQNEVAATQSAGRVRAARNEIDEFELSPMFGKLVDDRRLMLYRTVVHDTQGYRQGLLVDVDRLGTWLRERGVGPELAPYATMSFAEERESPASGSRAYRHRFAEPFEALSASLVLATLPGVGGAGSVYGLTALCLLATILGLAALYRMVTVVLRYSEQRNNFVAAVTHELRTPLTAIRMYGEMLRDGMVASEAKRDEYHRHITAESERLSRLVNNVLELSRLEKGARRAKLERADVAPVVGEVASLVRPHVESGGFALRLDLEHGLPPVRFDRDAVMQVLFNLVDNAVKYADDAATKEIVISARSDGAGVALRVRDHGPGVAAAQLRKIFEPFYRGESELTRRRKGTGLGLALVRGLGAEMGARVSGKNLAEGGFEVEIAFPPAPPA